MTRDSLFESIIELLVNDNNVKRYIGDGEGIAYHYTYSKLFKHIMNSKLGNIYNYFTNKNLFFELINYKLGYPDKLSIVVNGYNSMDTGKYIEIIEIIMKNTATTFQEDKQKDILYVEFTIPDLVTIEERVKEKLSEKLYNMTPLTNDIELWSKIIQDINEVYL